MTADPVAHVKGQIKADTAEPMRGSPRILMDLDKVG